MWFSKTLGSRPQESLQEATARWRVSYWTLPFDCIFSQRETRHLSHYIY